MLRSTPQLLARDLGSLSYWRYADGVETGCGRNAGIASHGINSFKGRLVGRWQGKVIQSGFQYSISAFIATIEAARRGSARPYSAPERTLTARS
jgi:hypothetical protein